MNEHFLLINLEMENYLKMRKSMLESSEKRFSESAMKMNEAKDEKEKETYSKKAHEELGKIDVLKEVIKTIDHVKTYLFSTLIPAFMSEYERKVNEIEEEYDQYTFTNQFFLTNLIDQVEKKFKTVENGWKKERETLMKEDASWSLEAFKQTEEISYEKQSFIHGKIKRLENEENMWSDLWDNLQHGGIRHQLIDLKNTKALRLKIIK